MMPDQGGDPLGPDSIEIDVELGRAQEEQKALDSQIQREVEANQQSFKVMRERRYKEMKAGN
jgi:hypothetical protein